jgi:hypothetical protein
MVQSRVAGGKRHRWTARWQAARQHTAQHSTAQHRKAGKAAQPCGRATRCCCCGQDARHGSASEPRCCRQGCGSTVQATLATGIVQDARCYCAATRQAGALVRRVRPVPTLQCVATCRSTARVHMQGVDCIEPAVQASGEIIPCCLNCIPVVYGSRCYEMPFTVVRHQVRSKP